MTRRSGLTIEDICRRCDVSLEVARKAILALEERGLIEARQTCDRCEGTGWMGHPDDPAGRCTQCGGSGEHASPLR